MNFYTNVTVRSGKILYRGIREGKRVLEKIQYSPTLFLYPKNNEETEYKTLDGRPLAPMKFDTIRECRDFISTYKDVQGFDIYGNSRFEHAFLSETFKNEVEFDQSLIQVDTIDIECKSDDGFPIPKHATQEITAITVHRHGKLHLFGIKAFVPHKDNVIYHKCIDERHLLISFLAFWSQSYPDIITGWNVQEFDLLYLFNRIRNVLNENEAKKLSPWNAVNERTKIVLFAGQPKTVEFVDIVGISTLDYLVLFKKLSPQAAQESYALDHIASVFLGEKKISYEEEYGNLTRLYEENPQLYYEYNIKDVELIEGLDKNQNLIRLALLLAYDAKCNYEDVFFQVRIWTQICHDFLFNKKKIVPPIINEIPTEDSTYEGAYVKEPKPGFKHDIISIDAESLYPSIIQCFNISPETFVRMDHVPSLEKLIDGEMSIEDDLTFCGNGARFRKDTQGFFVDLVDHYKVRRREAKNKMLEYETLKEKTKDKKYEALIETYDTRQNAMKVALNSLYGALGSKYFMFYDERLAKAITITGQYIIRRIEKHVNEYFNKLHTAEEPIEYCVYSDTDSIYMEMKPLLDKFFPNKMGLERIDVMNEMYKTTFDPKIKNISVETTTYLNAYRNNIIFKREIIGDKAIWTAKKRYIVNVWDKEGVRYDKPKMMIKGLEVKKSSTPKICKDKLNEAIKIIMNENEDSLIKFVKQFRLDWYKLQPEEIASPRSVKGLAKYRYAEKSVPIHVKGALVFNKTLADKKLTRTYEEIKDGNKIKFVYMKEPNPFGSHVLSFETKIPNEFEANLYIDYNTQFEKVFIEPLKTITAPIGWKTEKKISLLSKKKS